jgi:hypothetical protein
MDAANLLKPAARGEMQSLVPRPLWSNASTWKRMRSSDGCNRHGHEPSVEQTIDILNAAHVN